MPYVILSRGTEYNDEIYQIGGYDAAVAKNGFKTLEEAKTALAGEYKKELQHYQVGDFSYGDEQGWILAEEFGMAEDSPSYSDLIVKAEEAGVEWLSYMPNLLQIFEVNFDD